MNLLPILGVPILQGGSLSELDTFPGLVLWLRGDVGVDSSFAWVDQSASGNDLAQATASKKPTIVSGGLNGLDFVDFDGGDIAVKGSAPAGLPSAAFTVFAVIHTDDTTSFRVILNAGGASGLGYQTSVTTGKQRLVKNGVAAIGESDTGISVDTWYIIAATYDGADAAFYMNGAADGGATSAQTFTGTTDLFVGGDDATPTSPWDGGIAEIAYYSAVLSGVDIAAIFAKLNERWAVY